MFTGIKDKQNNITFVLLETTPTPTPTPIPQPQNIKITLNKTSLTLAIGKSATLLETVRNSTGIPKILWTSSNETVASVDQTGIVKGLKPGKAMITVSIEGTTASASCDVTVTFHDVAESKKFYYSPVYWAVEKDITTGYKDAAGDPTGYFGPNDTCTREQIVTFLWRMMGSPEPKTYPAFRDLKKGAYYYKAVAWAAENGITTGVRNDWFGVGNDCTREMCVTFLYRAAGNPAFTGGETFTDVVKNSYYEIPVKWASATGVTTGYKDSAGRPTGKFGVKDNCKRGEIVTFLYRFDQIK